MGHTGRMENATLVVLGPSGDMARRLLFPALVGLEQQKRLEDLRIVAYGRREWTRQQCLDVIEDGVRNLAGMDPAKSVWQRFARRVSYIQGDLVAEDIHRLHESVSGNAAFYLALPPDVFGTTAAALAKAGFSDESAGWRRLVLEKPFGSDLASAQRLNREIHRHWQEQQVYRIDHYLGKETVQNILVFRFANRFLEPILNCNHVDHVQITASERLGLEGRVGYYDGIGAMRDMLQSHLIQVMALVAMEPLALWNSDFLHEHKVEALRSVRTIKPDEVEQYAVRGQYGSGRVSGKQVKAYRQEEGIEPGSTTETFAALRLHLDNWRWAGTPFYLRSGKRLTSDLTEVAIHFREPPFRLLNGKNGALQGNRLVFRLRPHESINLEVIARAPGLEMTTENLLLHADYATGHSNAYGQLIVDLLEGERTAFLRFDEVEWAWRILEPVLDAWKKGEPDIYKPGSDGPASQHQLLAGHHQWRDLSAEPLPSHA